MLSVNILVKYYSQVNGNIISILSRDMDKYDTGIDGLFDEIRLFSLISEENIPCPEINSSHEWSTDFKK